MKTSKGLLADLDEVVGHIWRWLRTELASSFCIRKLLRLGVSTRPVYSEAQATIMDVQRRALNTILTKQHRLVHEDSDDDSDGYVPAIRWSDTGRPRQREDL